VEGEGEGEERKSERSERWKKRRRESVEGLLLASDGPRQV